MTSFPKESLVFTKFGLTNIESSWSFLKILNSIISDVEVLIKVETSKILSTLLLSMNKILDDSWRNKNRNVKLKNYRDVLILASIVEKETSLKEEKPIIAKIFLNRLDLNMKLQSDPTVIFAIEKQYGELNRQLTRKDLTFESDYNTYLHYGLPIGPISNPGKDSIEAIANPLNNNLLYFVADGTGAHIFSENYEEHLGNIKKIKKSKLD